MREVGTSHPSDSSHHILSDSRIETHTRGARLSPSSPSLTSRMRKYSIGCDQCSLDPDHVPTLRILSFAFGKQVEDGLGSAWIIVVSCRSRSIIL